MPCPLAQYITESALNASSKGTINVMDRYRFFYWQNFKKKRKKLEHKRSTLPTTCYTKTNVLKSLLNVVGLDVYILS